jgi:hypothetical protein
LQNYKISATQPSFYGTHFYLLSPDILNTIDCNTERIMLKKSAPKKPLIEKPSTSFEHNAIIAALITNRNNPSVKTVTGNVKITKIGFTNKFNNPKTMATIIADLNPLT